MLCLFYHTPQLFFVKLWSSARLFLAECDAVGETIQRPQWAEGLDTESEEWGP
jgi:hypothetical protein